MLYHYIYFIFFFFILRLLFLHRKNRKFFICTELSQKRDKNSDRFDTMLLVVQKSPTQLKRKIRLQHCYIFQFKIRKDFLQLIPATIGSHHRINVYSFVFDERLQNREIHWYLFPIRFPDLLKSSPAFDTWNCSWNHLDLVIFPLRSYWILNRANSATFDFRPTGNPFHRSLVYS